jgi:hypothetical protein
MYFFILIVVCGVLAGCVKNENFVGSVGVGVTVWLIVANIVVTIKLS